MASPYDSGIGMTMPVQPLNYGLPMGGYGGFGGFGAGLDGWWIILLLLCLNGGGWGFGGFGGAGAMMGMGMMDGFGLYPWLNNSQNINGGFRDQMLGNQLTGIGDKISSGFGDVQLGISGLSRDICQTGNQLGSVVQNGFAQAEIAAGGRHSALTQQLYQGEINGLNRSFAEQQANQQGFAGVSAGLADVKYTEATEACATRTANYQNTRDIIDNQNRVGQSILDKLCQLELDNEKAQSAAKDREIDRLQADLLYARNQADRATQTATFERGLVSEVDALYNRLKNCPVNAVPVAGNTPLFSCNPGFNSPGCGCGMAA